MKKKLVAIGLGIATAFTCLTGCADKGDGKFDVDKSKTQIYLSVYNGGVGTKWIEDLCVKWNATDDKYQVIPVPDRVSTKDLINSLETETTEYDVYYTAEAGFQLPIYKDKLEDLTDLGNMKNDGESKTIKEKIGTRSDYFDTVWKDVATKHGEGLYMLPYCDNFNGLIYDHQTFIENDLYIYAKNEQSVLDALIEQGIAFEVDGAKVIFKSYSGNYKYFTYKEGDRILSCGKDGIYGSYDDGQPITETEWKQLLAKITSKNKRAFIWSGKYAGYAEAVFHGIMANYSGLDEYNAYYKFNHSVHKNGQVIDITPDNGYEVYGMDGFKTALKFQFDYIFNSNYYDSRVEKSNSHTDTQGLFILGHRQSSGQPMMLIDGTWFENEAKSVFNTQSLINEKRGYGDREYRFMLYPALNGGYGIDGNGNGTILNVLNSGAILVPKTKKDSASQAKLSQIKKFLAWTLSDENLAAFTVETGITNAYSYELSDEDLAKLTPFSRNVNAMYMDSENIQFSRALLLHGSSPVKFATSGGFFSSTILTTYNKSEYENLWLAYRALQTDRNGNNRSNQQIIDCLAEGAENYYSHGEHKGDSRATWEDLISQARAAGFYKN